MEPYLDQLKPEAEKDMIKACSKLALVKIRRLQKQRKKRKRESSSSSSSSTGSSSSSSSTQYSSDEDMFEERKKKKKNKTNGRTSISQTQQSEYGENPNQDPLLLSDDCLSD